MCPFWVQYYFEKLFWAIQSILLFQNYWVNVLLAILFAALNFTWLKWLLNQKYLQNRVFCNKKKKVLRQRRYWELLFGKSGGYKFKYTFKPLLSQNMLHFTGTMKSAQGPWISLTSSTELKSSFPLTDKNKSAVILKVSNCLQLCSQSATVSTFYNRLDSLQLS